MLVAAMYNIVDTYFVSQIDGLGDAAANALSLAFPIQMLMTALNVGTGVGTGAALSKAIGGRDREKASKIAGNAMFLYSAYYAFMLLFGLFAAKPFISLFTDNADVLRLGSVYLSFVTCLSFGNMGEKCFEKLLQATGKTTCSMIGQLTGSALNVILVPVFIFGYFGIPIIGYNFGAKNGKRIKNTIRCAISMVLTVMVSGTVIFQIFAEQIVGIFQLSDEFTAICVTAIHIITCEFVFAGMNVLFQGVCQAMGGSVQSLIISMLRLVVIVLPVAAAFARLSNAGNHIWLAFPIAEAASFLVAVILTVRIYKKTAKKI